MTLRTRDEETAEYFISVCPTDRRAPEHFKRRGLFGLGKYEGNWPASETEDRETRSQDESIKTCQRGRWKFDVGRHPRYIAPLLKSGRRKT
jgi:hypothetical protein